MIERVHRINPTTIAAPAPHYSHGISLPGAMRTTITSGQVGIAPDGAIPPTIEAQLDLVWSNTQAILAADGLKFTDIVSVCGYLTDSADVPHYRAKFKAMLGDTRPTSTLVIVKALVSPQLKVEIEVIAAWQ